MLLTDITDNTFTNIIEIYNINYAPFSIYNASNNKSVNIIKTLNDWFKGKAIPSWQKNLERLLINLKVNYPED